MEKEYYVYYWYYNDNNTIFYVGKGKGDRYKSKEGRNKIFNAMVLKHSCFQEIFMKDLTEYEAVLVERALIEMLILLRHPLLNIQMKGVCQSDGIERAKLNGKYSTVGRKLIKPDKNIFDEIYPEYKKGKVRAKDFMEALNLKKMSFYRRIAEYEKQTCIKNENLNTIHHENIKNMQVSKGEDAECKN